MFQAANDDNGPAPHAAIRIGATFLQESEGQVLTFSLEPVAISPFRAALMPVVTGIQGRGHPHAVALHRHELLNPAPTRTSFEAMRAQREAQKAFHESKRAHLRSV